MLLIVNFFDVLPNNRNVSFFELQKFFVDNKKKTKKTIWTIQVSSTQWNLLWPHRKKKLPQLIVKYRAFNIIVRFDENLKDTKRDTLYTYMAYSRLERATSKNPSLYTWSSHTTGIPEPDFNSVGGGWRWGYNWIIDFIGVTYYFQFKIKIYF